MTKFRIGDRVKVVGNRPINQPRYPDGTTGTIVALLGGMRYSIDWDNGYQSYIWTDVGDIKLINDNKTIMAKVGIMMKKLLDKDTQILVEAGFINGDLELTCLGRTHLDAILFTANKGELIKLAKDSIAEDKANKN